MGQPASALPPRRQSLRCARQHHRRRGVSARTARPLRHPRFPRSLQCRSCALGRSSRNRASAACGDARLPDPSRADRRRKFSRRRGHSRRGGEVLDRGVVVSACPSNPPATKSPASPDAIAAADRPTVRRRIGPVSRRNPTGLFVGCRTGIGRNECDRSHRAVGPWRRFGVGDGQHRNSTHGRQDKSADLRRAHVVGWIGFFGTSAHRACWRSCRKDQRFQRPERRRRSFPEARAAMTTRDDDLHVRPGRIGHGNQGAKRPKTFVGEVMRAAKKAGPSRQHVRPARRLCGALHVRPRPARRPVSVDPASRTARRHHDADRPPSGIEVPLGAAVEARRLPQARGRHPRRRGRPDVRRPLRRRRREGVRRAMRGRPPPLPVHRIPRGRGRDGRSSRLHPRTDVRRRTRSRHEARLGRRRSLEHGQSAHPCAGARARRRRRGSRHQPRLHQAGIPRPRRRARHVGARPAYRTGHPDRPGEGGRGRALDEPRSLAARHLRRGRRRGGPPPRRRRRRPRTEAADDRASGQARTPRARRAGRLRTLGAEAGPRAGAARPRHPRRHHQDDAPGDEQARATSRT